MSYVDEEMLSNAIADIRAADQRRRDRRVELLIQRRMAQSGPCYPCNTEVTTSVSATLIDWKVKRSVQVSDIVGPIAKFFGVDRSKLNRRSRLREIVVPRQIAMYFLKIRTGMSLVAIGQVFGGFDHTTCLYAIKTVKDLIATDAKYAEDISYIDTLIK